MKRKNNNTIWLIAILITFSLFMAVFANIDLIIRVNNNKYFKNISDKVENSLTQILEKQDEVATLINNATKKSEYTFNNPYVLSNPFQVNPLSAILVFRTDTEESIELYVNDVLMSTFEYSKIHIIPVYGLCADTNNFVTIKSSDKKENTIRITTKNYNSFIGDLDIKKLKENENSYMLLGPIGNKQSQLRGFDYRGNLIYLITLKYINAFKLNKGNILLSYNSSIEKENKDLLIEMDYLGYIVSVKEDNNLETSYNHTIKDEMYLGNKISMYEKNSKNYQVVTRIYELREDKVQKVNTRDIEMNLDNAKVYNGSFALNVNGSRIETGLQYLDMGDVSLIMVRKNSDYAYIRYLKYSGGNFNPNFVFNIKGSYSLYLRIKDNYYTLNSILEIK